MNFEHILLQKLFLYFDILTISPTLNLRPSLLFSLLKSLCVFRFTPTGFILMVLWYVFLYLLARSYSLSIYTFSIWSHKLINFVRQGSIKSLRNNKFFFTMHWIHFIVLFSTKTSLIYCKIHCLYVPIFCLVCN